MGSGLHELVIGIGPLDLSGKGLESEARRLALSRVDSSIRKVVFPRHRILGRRESTVGNVLGFHELHGGFGDRADVCADTGCMTRRWGSFCSRILDGVCGWPNLYQYGLNSPFNNSDPMGLAVYFFDGTCNNMDNPETPPTNVEKLYNAVDLTKTKREYLPGVWLSLLAQETDLTGRPRTVERGSFPKRSHPIDGDPFA